MKDGVDVRDATHVKVNGHVEKIVSKEAQTYLNEKE